MLVHKILHGSYCMNRGKKLKTRLMSSIVVNLLKHFKLKLWRFTLFIELRKDSHKKTTGDLLLQRVRY
jgi:hypothetical protein